MKTIHRIILIVLFALVIVTQVLMTFAPQKPRALPPPPKEHGTQQSRCQAILGNNPGAIMVFDLQNDVPTVMVNPETCFRRAFMPGSLFKLVTAAALLESGKIDPREKHDCRNYFKLQGREYICSEPGGHGNVDLIGALAKSCSVYFYNTAPRLKPGDLTNTAIKMGLGRSYKGKNIDVETAPGVLAAPLDPRDFLDFCVGDNPGIQVTPWQVANMAAIIARGRALSPDVPAPSLKDITWQVLQGGMEKAAVEGTCKDVALAGIDAAGKTGTAQNPYLKGKTHGWFAGYLPTRNPRYVVVVFLEDGKGYVDAVPLAVKVMQELKGTPPPK